MIVAPSEPEPFHKLGAVLSTDIEASWGVDFFWLAAGWGPCGVQRKEHGDLINSMNDHRLPEQVMKMGQLGLAVLMIEGYGNWTPDGFLIAKWGRTNIRRSTLRKFLWKVAARGVWVIQTDNIYDSIGTLMDLEAWTTKEEHGSLITRATQKTPLGARPLIREQQEWFLMGFQGMGPKVAGRVLDHFGRMPIAWTVPKRELKEVPGVGKVMVDNWWKVLDGGPDDPPRSRGRRTRADTSDPGSSGPFPGKEEHDHPPASPTA